MPEEVYATGPATNAEFDTTALRFTYTSLVTPSHGLRRGPRHRRAHAAQAAPRCSAATTRRTTRPAGSGPRRPTASGCRSPTSTARTSPLDGTAPCLLYGYGSYEASIDPGFSSLRLSLLDRGFVFAIAHVRGGGELGRPWYDDGKLLHKRNTFTDFVAAAEHLVAEGFTAPDRLVARGGSAGGLLMGAVANLRPDLFAASWPRCPSSTASRRSSTRRSRSPSPSGRSGATRSTTPRCTPT